MELSIIIPARREEDAIVSTLKQLERDVRVPHEILVVDDGVDPADKTADVAAVYAKRHPTVSVIRKKPGDRDGFAAALARGVARARGKAVVFVMADCCDEPATINTMMRKLEEGYDVVCGSRYMPGGKRTGGPRLQNIGSRLINATLLRLGFPTSDATNSLKTYRLKCLKKLSPAPFAGTECSLWLIVQAYWHDCRIAEVPTTWRGRMAGSSKTSFWVRSPGYFTLFAVALSACGLVKLRNRRLRF